MEPRGRGRSVVVPKLRETIFPQKSPPPPPLPLAARRAWHSFNSSLWWIDSKKTRRGCCLAGTIFPLVSYGADFPRPSGFPPIVLAGARNVPNAPRSKAASKMKTLLLSCSSSAETPVSPVSPAPAGCVAELFARGREKEKAESRQFRLPGLEQLRGTREPSRETS